MFLSYKTNLFFVIFQLLTLSVSSCVFMLSISNRRVVFFVPEGGTLYTHDQLTLKDVKILKKEKRKTEIFFPFKTVELHFYLQSQWINTIIELVDFVHRYSLIAVN